MEMCCIPIDGFQNGYGYIFCLKVGLQIRIPVFWLDPNGFVVFSGSGFSLKGRIPSILTLKFCIRVFFLPTESFASVVNPNMHVICCPLLKISLGNLYLKIFDLPKHFLLRIKTFTFSSSQSNFKYESEITNA